MKTPSPSKKSWYFRGAGGTLTSDAGLLLVREFDEQLRLSVGVVNRIVDTRDPRSTGPRSSAWRAPASIGFVRTPYGPDEHPPDLILDLDSTDGPTHGGA